MKYLQAYAVVLFADFHYEHFNEKILAYLQRQHTVTPAINL